MALGQRRLAMLKRGILCLVVPNQTHILFQGRRNVEWSTGGCVSAWESQVLLCPFLWAGNPPCPPAVGEWRLGMTALISLLYRLRKDLCRKTLTAVVCRLCTSPLWPSPQVLTHYSSTRMSNKILSDSPTSQHLRARLPRLWWGVGVGMKTLRVFT